MRRMILLMAAWSVFAFAKEAVASEPDGSLVAIYGNESVPVGERRFAESLAHHVVRWYQEAGGITCVLTDDTTLKTALVNKQIALLVYLATPTTQQLQELRKFVGGGGGGLVFF
ncbi:MAG: hypothetical protein FWH21_01605 [Kiritimatiellaeota bacterium]|nr:hypothetical protein [Kiritimatiellota bacterium]